MRNYFIYPVYYVFFLHKSRSHVYYVYYEIESFFIILIIG